MGRRLGAGLVDERRIAPTQVLMGSGPKPFPRDYRLPPAHAAPAPMLALRAPHVPVAGGAQTCGLGAKTRAGSNIAAAADAVAKVGRCPPPRSSNFSTAQTFMSTIFFAIVRQRASREDDYESNTRWTWLRRRAGA